MFLPLNDTELDVKVLLRTASQLMVVCRNKPAIPTQHYCLLLARMTMLLEYLVRHLYEPPPTLLPQIQDNLFRHRYRRQGCILHRMPKEGICYVFCLPQPWKSQLLPRTRDRGPVRGSSLLPSLPHATFLKPRGSQAGRSRRQLHTRHSRVSRLPGAL